MCPRSPCKAAAEPILEPRTPSPGLLHIITGLTVGLREASSCENQEIHSVSSRKNSQALGGLDAASTMVYLFYMALECILYF